MVICLLDIKSTTLDRASVNQSNHLACYFITINFLWVVFMIRNLPVPILTREYLQPFVSIADISDLKEQVRTLNLLVLLLPSIHQRMLKVGCESWYGIIKITS